jgi:hypothetical protein
MTNNVIPQSVLSGMSASAFFKLKLALEIAMDKGGFEAVVAVCKDMTDGAAETDRHIGIWADAEWRGLDFLADKFPGSTNNLSKYQYVFDGSNANQDESEDQDEPLTPADFQAQLYPQTTKGYEGLIFYDTVEAMTGRTFDINRTSAELIDGVRKWGLLEFPDFQLSAKRIKEAVALAAAIRQSLTRAVA